MASNNTNNTEQAKISTAETNDVITYNKTSMAGNNVGYSSYVHRGRNRVVTSEKIESEVRYFFLTATQGIKVL
ncbi:MAG: hypothetical protein ACK4HE_08660 [Chitinophagaceae bacterium]